jgi:hypothetical protein
VSNSDYRTVLDELGELQHRCTSCKSSDPFRSAMHVLILDGRLQFDLCRECMQRVLTALRPEAAAVTDG